MLEVGKTPHIEVKGLVPLHVFQYLKRELGDNVIFVDEDEDELVNIEDTGWYRKMRASRKPGSAVKVYRENVGLTQAELGRKLGKLSRHRISDIENGHREISKELAKNLAGFFKVSVDRFI
jgi:DNA-binding XRE family transcriptional regulator